MGEGWHKSLKTSTAPVRCRVCRGGCHATDYSSIIIHKNKLSKVLKSLSVFV